MKLRKFRKRTGRCYELSFATILDNPDWLLVHGSVNGRYERIGHAWLEKDGMIYDAVLNERMPKDVYFEKYDVENCLTCANLEAAKLVLSTGHYGPWTPEEVVKAQQNS